MRKLRHRATQPASGRARLQNQVSEPRAQIALASCLRECVWCVPGVGGGSVGRADVTAGHEKHRQLRFLVTFPEAEADSDGTCGAGRLLGLPSPQGTTPGPPVVG